MGERKPVSPEDAALWQQVLAGDADAMTRLVERHRLALTRHAATLCDERPALPVTADDLVGTTCIRFVRLVQLVQELKSRNADSRQQEALWQELTLRAQAKAGREPPTAKSAAPNSVPPTSSPLRWLHKLLETERTLGESSAASPAWRECLTQFRQRMYAALRNQSASPSQFDRDWEALQQRWRAEQSLAPVEESDAEREEECGPVDNEELLKWLMRLKEIKPLLARGNATVPADWSQINQQILARHGAAFHVRGWLFTVLKNLVKDERKRCAREARRHRDAGREGTVPPERVAVEEDRLELERRLRALQGCLEGLSDEQRLVALLRQGGWKNTEIAEVLAMPDNTVASHLSRALTSLKPCVQGKLGSD